MKYKLISAQEENLELLIKYKLKTIFEYAVNLSEEEIKKINRYVKNNIPKQINNYKIISVNKNIAGTLLVLKHLDGVLIDELYFDEEYRNKKIGTSIILNILNSNKIVYLWVYKNNKKGIKLYKKLGFKIIEETDNRLFMKYNKL
ncbi:MAG: GNAT family N-acetyltransferase [Bacilli bacterium]|nr:GNAT family N-acetyltransferase [Bacilli bacterium]